MDDDDMIDGTAPRRGFARDRLPSPSAAAALAAPTEIQSTQATLGVRLFDPTRLLGFIAVLFWPLKFVSVLLIPAVLLAALTMYKHWTDIAFDVHRLLGEFSFVVHLLFSLLIINLGVRLAMGAVVRAHGGAVRDFGLIFFLGMIPRFYVDRSAIPRLDRSGQLWAYAAPLLVRLGFFAFGMLVWATYRSNQTWVSSLALLVSQAGLWSFLFAVMPFMPGDGYNWLAVYFRQPMLRQKAFMALNAKLRGRPLPPGIRSQSAMLVAFAVGIIVALLVFGAAVLSIAAVLLTRQMQGLGALIFLVLIGGFVAWLLTFRAMRPERKRQQVRLLRAALAGQADDAEARAAPAVARPLWHWMIWAFLAAALIGVAFLPYSYDPAGPFLILPVHSTKVIARTSGTVVDVLAREGEQVAAGQVLVRLSSADQERDVAVTRAALDGAEARVAGLAGTAADDGERENVQGEVERLRAQLDADQAGLAHTSIRAPSAGVVATPHPQFLHGVWLNAGDEILRIDDSRTVEAQIEIAEDDISLVKVGAQVRLRAWSEENREIIGSVAEIAPSALNRADRQGTVIRAAVQERERLQSRRRGGDLTGSDDAGDADLLNAMRTRAAAARADGANAESSAASAATGRTPAAAPGAEKAEEGGAIRVKATVANADGLLRPAMTGYAKIGGPEMPVWQAYRRLCIRFFTVELWSWVP